MLSQPLSANMPSKKRGYEAALGQLQELLGSMPASASGDRADDRDDDDDDDRDDDDSLTIASPVADDEVQDSVVYKYWE